MTTTEKTVLNTQDIPRLLASLSGRRVTGQLLDCQWIHPFSARMPTCVAEYLIEHFTTPAATVLDPMAGSGTTVVAAKRLARRSLGFDRDPMAVLIAQTAVQEFLSDRLDQLNNRILNRAKEEFRSGKLRLPEIRSALPIEDQEFIRFWFPPLSQKQLFALAESIACESDKSEQQLAWVVFSTLIIAKSAGASFALDISHSRPHKRMDKPVVLPFERWNRRFKQVVSHLAFVDGDLSARRGESLVMSGDARSLPLAKETVDFVLTSPPYVNAIDYLRAHKFSLVWMGYKLRDLREIRGTMMGTERGLWNLDGLPPSLEQQLIRKVKIRAKQAIVRRYLSDLRQMILEIHRVLKPGGLSFLVLGPTIMNSRRSDIVEIVCQIGEGIGLKILGSVDRTLNHIRRSLPPPSIAKNSLRERMHREIIVAMSK